MEDRSDINIHKTISKILDNHCEIVLVGDSVATALYGMKNTREINLETMINHAISVKKSLKRLVKKNKIIYKNKILEKMECSKKDAKLFWKYVDKLDGKKQRKYFQKVYNRRKMA